MSVWAVIVAAGRGERLGAGRPKAFITLAGRPLLAEPLGRLGACPLVDRLVVVAPPGWETAAGALADEVAPGALAAVVTGGETRSASVRAGVAHVSGDAAAIVVHDAARPLVSDGVVARVLAPLAEGYDGAVPGLPVADTVKRAPEGTVVETVPRDGLYSVQTPQAFRAECFRRALAGALVDASDCASFVEAAGGRVRVVPGDPRLLKVTTAADLRTVENLLGAQDEEELER